ncbi:hypothetical protein M9H77_19786 [Catharanthus roseus]|uniref:Uncharacterized protein n=1 Tax=Catharanthus roseus TaxID=4058 RepID=A0ACC0BBC6_CATRO|nr:hypothetical protein M9H77_19786 [Catharanthus roseus]
MLKPCEIGWMLKRPARRGVGRYNNYNIQHNNDYDGGDVRLKVDIPSFYGNLERNDLRKSEVHQVTRYLDAIKVELMIRDRDESRFEGNRRTYDNDNVQRSNNGEDTSRRWNQGTEWNEDKGHGKKVAESKEGQKAATNPYAKSISGKCFHYVQPGHRSNECPARNLLI